MCRELRLVALAGVLMGAALAGGACAPDRAIASASQDAGAGEPPVAVTVTEVTPCDIEEAVAVVGSLMPKFFADVKSEVSGTVTAVYVTEWLPVSKGRPLARLDTSETEAAIVALKAGERQAAVAETKARREYERAKHLEEYGLITPQMLDDATSLLEAAEAAVAAARAQVRTAEARLAKSFIASPMAGVVAERHVNVGDRVENMGGSAMFRIVDTHLLELTASVPASRLASLRVGQRMEFTTDALGGRVFSGTVQFINPVIDAANRAVRVVVEVPNAAGVLSAGLFVHGRIVTHKRQGVLQVPRDALVNWDVGRQQADVFVVRDARAEKRRVTTGIATEQNVEVSNGLSVGDRVVTRGAFAARDGGRITVVPGEGG